MKIDFEQVLHTLKGEPFRQQPTAADVFRIIQDLAQESPDKTLDDASREIMERMGKLQGEPQILADVCHDALLSGEKATKGNASEKRARAKVASKVCHGGVVEIGEADLGLLKEELERHCNAAALFACDKALVEFDASERPAEAAE